MLNIDMSFNQGLLIVRLKGVLNGDTSYILHNDVFEVVKDNGVKYVLFNLTNLDYVDKYGLDVIKIIYKKIKENKGKFILCGIDKLLDYNINIMDNLYQINDEIKAYDIVKL